MMAVLLFKVLVGGLLIPELTSILFKLWLTENRYRGTPQGGRSVCYHAAPLFRTHYLLLTSLTAYYHMKRVSDSIFYSSFPNPRPLYFMNRPAFLPQDTSIG